MRSKIVNRLVSKENGAVIVIDAKEINIQTKYSVKTIEGKEFKSKLLKFIKINTNPPSLCISVYFGICNEFANPVRMSTNRP